MTLEERFWAKVDKSGDCWVWTGYKTHGYGKIRVGGRKGTMVKAHRVSYELENGFIPKGEGFHGTCVLHFCDNRACVRPDHLFLGTQADNIDDMRSKGRGAWACGEKSGKTKLTNDSVRLIKRFLALPKGRFKQATIGKLFGASHNVICDINTGRTWSHI